MVVVVGIVELLTARRFEIVDPSEAVLIDELGVEAKWDDDQIFRCPALVCCEPPHHRGAAVQIAPPLEVSDGDVKFATRGLEQIAQIELLDRGLDIDIKVIPEAKR